MSNYSKVGRIDRRRSMPMRWIHVNEEMAKVYDGAPVYEKAKLESEVYRSAYENLSDEDKANIKSLVQKFDTTSGCHPRKGSVKIKGFGELAVLETCAKLGIWLNAVGGK